MYWAIIAGDNAAYYTYELDDQGDCTIIGGIKPGLPPDLGVTLSPPVIIGILVAAGLLLLAGAWFLRSRLPARRAAV